MLVRPAVELLGRDAPSSSLLPVAQRALEEIAYLRLGGLAAGEVHDQPARELVVIPLVVTHGPQGLPVVLRGPVVEARVARVAAVCALGVLDRVVRVEACRVVGVVGVPLRNVAPTDK